MLHLYFQDRPDVPLEVVILPIAARNAHKAKMRRQQSPLMQIKERRRDLLCHKVAGDAEDDERGG